MWNSAPREEEMDATGPIIVNVHFSGLRVIEAPHLLSVKQRSTSFSGHLIKSFPSEVLACLVSSVPRTLAGQPGTLPPRVEGRHERQETQESQLSICLAQGALGLWVGPWAETALEQWRWLAGQPGPRGPHALFLRLHFSELAKNRKSFFLTNRTLCCHVYSTTQASGTIQ